MVTFIFKRFKGSFTSFFKNLKGGQEDVFGDCNSNITLFYTFILIILESRSFTRVQILSFLKDKNLKITLKKIHPRQEEVFSLNSVFGNKL